MVRQALTQSPDFFFFFFNDPAPTEIYTLPYTPLFRSQTDLRAACPTAARAAEGAGSQQTLPVRDRKSTRLNSSHGYISYAVFCLKKKIRSTDTIGCGTDASHSGVLAAPRDYTCVLLLH